MRADRVSLVALKNLVRNLCVKASVGIYMSARGKRRRYRYHVPGLKWPSCTTLPTLRGRVRERERRS